MLIGSISCPIVASDIGGTGVLFEKPLKEGE
jgi:hypothetical protein